jgi:uncharacterized protein YyaL (SSP411 family)
MNHLQYETSPYLLQHADNPVDWHPWGDEAFRKAKAENKPVFLSVGYSTCHWCHVMAHESFEDTEVAEVLNRDYVCVKVDKEERPDIDSIYMSVCMALTGSGGWPMTIIMEHTGKPFFAGTYFPKTRRYGTPGLLEILEAIRKRWDTDKEALLAAAGQITEHLNTQSRHRSSDVSSEDLCENAAVYFEAAFDPEHGGFGRAPKFPSPHNLLFLMALYEAGQDKRHLTIAETTLTHMARGGIFDHIGFGFSRYSTDAMWLVPHFEKMLYDNALLIMAYTKAFELTGNPFYQSVAEKTILYIQREMTHPDGGFYSAQDADSDGVEGKYYVFTPEEITAVLGEREGAAFSRAYDIAASGNFEGKNIPNQIAHQEHDGRFDKAIERLYEYRKTRTSLHKDDKILTAWNALMIAALSDAAVVFGEKRYLEMAQRALAFVEKNLCADGKIIASWRDGRRSESGFLDDYAFLIYAQLRLYRASLEESCLSRAVELTRLVIRDYFDDTTGGFYLYTNTGGELILRPKESYDGAIPSGNSVMMMNLAILSLLTADKELADVLDQQLGFMNAQAAEAPGGHAFYLYSLLQRDFPGRKITAVLAHPAEREAVKDMLRGNGWVIILDLETEEFRLKDGKNTFYLCENNVCMPPVNELITEAAGSE